MDAQVLAGFNLTIALPIDGMTSASPQPLHLLLGAFFVESDVGLMRPSFRGQANEALGAASPTPRPSCSYYALHICGCLLSTVWWRESML